MKQLDHEHFQILCNAGTLQKLPKGHIFYDGYDNLDAIYCLTDGLCALMSLKDSGKEHIYHYLKPGSIIGFTPAFLEYTHEQDTTSEAYFLLKAKSNCTVYRLEKERIFELMQTYPQILKFIMLSMANTSRNLLKHFYTAQESNAASKIAFTLLSLAEEVNGDFILHKEFNYPELSKYLGIHHITVARIIGSFKDEGIIKKLGHSIKILDQEALMDYAQNKKILQY
ncbi:Crp/Fnr family transcriptional regulator [Niameybacter massiliensis]|uniref:Crp/Fnr family transcriptional regulator n=1 Tax=Niameybacter massiliensis TaxID=1658108 RepID=UPI0006B4E425|nr:Crp/Fnr family transcriptional regulator [Niameybacter massiliensis]